MANISDITALVGTLLVPALAVDARGRIAAVNDALAGCLKLAAAELVGSELAGWIIDAAALPDFRRATAATPGDFRFRTGDGGACDLALTLIVHTSGHAVLTALETTATAQVLAERALRDSEARLRHSQQHLERAQRVAATGSAERNLVTGAEEWSDEMFRLLGLERAAFALTDEIIFSLVHEDDRERVTAAIAMSRAGKPPAPGEFRIVRPDGEILTLYWETEVLCDGKGAPIRSTSVFKDVTELRGAEKREREMERQLLHAQKLEVLGTLAGGVAHDLNNTLVPILALTKVTANRLPADSRERKNLLTVMEACERARSLVQRILAFSRKQISEKRPFDLAATVREALRMLRAGLPATVQIVEHVADVPSFFGDGSQLHQVIVNLVTNAAQAIDTAMGTITIELKRLDGDAGVHLAVSDTGCGMDDATAARIFEPFFTTKEVGQGTGLGLSMVHGIVSSHGGRIEVSSRLGDGTTFDIYLPLSQQATHASIEQARAAKYRGIPATAATGRIARKRSATAARLR
jgi:PAS domain S-box-containing protein